MKWQGRVVLGLILALAWMVFQAPASAQTASIVGTIFDPAGGVIADAKVTATNTQTGAVREITSNDTGLYRVTNLIPGTYSLDISKEGFETLHFDNVVLTVDQAVSLDLHMKVGSVSTTAEVSASIIPPVELENAQISNLVDSKRMTDLPLLTRDPYQLVLLSPGMIQSNSSLGGFSANGTSERNNNFLLDGVDNNDAEVPGIAGGLNSLNPDSTQEFRVVTNNFSSEYGRNNGALIEVITKSGTNELHGSAYWFGRYSALGARDFFNPASGDNGGPKNPYTRNDFGASAGGAIIKNKLFWFGNYEGQRFITTLTNASVVPTAAFKTGQFVVTQDANGNPLPTPVPVDVSTPGSANNAQGLSLDPNVQQILSLYPNPNGPLTNDISGLYYFPSASRQQVDDFTVKVDYNINSRNTLSVRYSFNRFTDPNPFHSDILPGDLAAIDSYQRTQNAGIGLTTTFTNTLINEFHFGANRTNLQFNCTGTSVFNSFGNVDTLGRGPDYNFPDITGFGCQGLGDSDGQARFTGTYQTRDTVSWVKGRHTFKFGGEFRDSYSNSYDNFSTRQSLGFSAYTDYGVPSVNNVPDAVASNAVIQDQVFGLLGLVDSQSESQYFNTAGARTADDLRGFRQREWAGFVQDTWKLKPNLTLNLGLRWEYFGVPFEVNNQLSNLFADASGFAPFTFTIVGPGTGHTLYPNEYNNFEPRVGLAWDPTHDGKTAVRLAYGIYHDRVYGNLVGNARGNPPFTQPFAAGPFVQTTDLVIPDTVPTSPVVTNIDPETGLGGQVYADLFDPNFKTPYSQNWNVGIQRQITPSLSIEVNYVGVAGTHLFRVVDANPPQPNLVSQLVSYCSAPNPYGCVESPTESSLTFASLWLGQEFGLLPFNAVNNNAFESPFSTPGSVLNKSIGTSSYNALQVNVQKKMSHGFQFQGAYTYSHAISNVNDPLAPAAGNRSFPRNTFDLSAERGNSDFDVRQRGVINFIYEPNIGRGRGHWSEGFTGRVLEGWTFSGLFDVQTGLPFDLFGYVDSNHTGLSARLTQTSPVVSQPKGADKTYTGPTASSFELTPYDQQPNLGRNKFYGPGYINFDCAAYKNTAINERVTFQLRFEFYNLFNHAQFAQPGNSWADLNTFGVSTATILRPDGTTSARQIQIAAKILF